MPWDRRFPNRISTPALQCHLKKQSRYQPNRESLCSLSFYDDTTGAVPAATFVKALKDQ